MITDTGKGKDTFPNRAAVNFLAELFGRVDAIYVDDRAAMGADEVGMGEGVALKAFHAVDDTHGADDAFLLEECQVAVHRAEGKVGDRGLELGEDPFGAGVGFGRADTF